jgi:hypothetical protein
MASRQIGNCFKLSSIRCQLPPEFQQIDVHVAIYSVRLSAVNARGFAVAVNITAAADTVWYSIEGTRTTAKAWGPTQALHVTPSQTAKL